MGNSRRVPERQGSSASRFIPALFITLVGAVILLIAAAEEPYHIDELRQVRSYGNSFESVVEDSRRQEQPPLDPVLNAVAQRVIGIGDIRQRSLSVVFGIGCLLLVGVLTTRAGFTPTGSAFSVAVMAFTPFWIEVSAYARPYALPLFLMLGFLLLGDRWIESGSRWLLLPLVVAAITLPWSRTVEPVIFLFLVVIASGILGYVNRRQTSRAAVLGVIALVGLASGGGALWFVSDEIADRTASGGSHLTSRLLGLVTEIPRSLGEAFPYWPAVLVGLVLVLVFPVPRQLLFSKWWWWVLTGTCLGFLLAFSVVAPVEQTFQERYLFTWIPPLAVLVGAVVSSSSTLTRESQANSGLFGWIVSSLVVLIGIATTLVQLTTTTRANWQPISDVIAEDLPRDTEIIFDYVAPLGSYRSPFAGHPRYTGDHDVIPTASRMIREPSVVDGGNSTAIVLLDLEQIEVDGWIPVSVGDGFTVYLPETPRPGREGVAYSVAEFGKALGLDRGAVMRLASAALWLDLGDEDRSLELIEPLLEDPDLAPRALDAISSTPLTSLVEERR